MRIAIVSAAAIRIRVTAAELVEPTRQCEALRIRIPEHLSVAFSERKPETQLRLPLEVASICANSVEADRSIIGVFVAIAVSPVRRHRPQVSKTVQIRNRAPT